MCVLAACIQHSLSCLCHQAILCLSAVQHQFRHVRADCFAKFVPLSIHLGLWFTVWLSNCLPRACKRHMHPRSRHVCTPTATGQRAVNLQSASCRVLATCSQTNMSCHPLCSPEGRLHKNDRYKKSAFFHVNDGKFEHNALALVFFNFINH